MSEQPVAPIRSAPIIRPATVNDGGQQATVFSTGAMQIVQGPPRPNMNVLVVKQHEAASAAPGYVLLPHNNMSQTATTIIRQPMNVVGGSQVFVRTQAPLVASTHLLAGSGTNTGAGTGSFMVQSSASTGDSLNGASVDSNGTASGAAANRTSVGMPRTPSTGAASNELVAKCNQFFNTLLQLASHQSKTTHEAVRNLAQSLIDGKINAQTFTARLQEQLNSTPQPNLVPFLDKTLPAFRSQLALGRMTVDGIRAPPSAESKPASNESQNGLESEQKPAASMDKLGDTFSAVIDSAASHDGPRTPSPAARVRPSKPIVSSNRKAAPRTNPKTSQPVSTPASASDRRTLPEDDEADEEALDNLMEEKQASASSTLVFTARSFRDDNALDLSGLRRRTSELANRAGLDGLNEGALQLLANAVQQRVRLLLEQLTVVTEHRLELYARDPRFEPLPAGDAKASFKTLEDADRLEQARHAKEQEQSLLRAAKSRTKTDDPDQAKLKQKAKELAQAQLEEKKQQAANLTALAAIGGARKRKFDEPTPSASNVSVDSPLTPSVVPIIRQTATTTQPAPSASQSASSLTITRLKRATMKDLLFVLEQSPDYAQSKLLYRLALK